MDRFAIHNLFGISGFTVAWYGVIIGCAFMVGILLADYRSKSDGIDPNRIYEFAILLLPTAIVTARIYYVIFEWDQYKDHLWEIFAIKQGGLAVFGGIIGGVLLAVLFCRKHGIYFLRFVDILIPSLPLGQAIGRWGNFINQEAYGNVVTDGKLQFFPYAVYIDNLGEWHQATFFYESAGNVILFVCILLAAKKFEKYGYLLVMYLIGYGCIRFFVEGLRSDSLYLVPGIRVSQVLSLLLVPLGIALAVYIKRFGRRKEFVSVKQKSKKE